MSVDPTTTKYVIHATIKAEGVIEKPDIIGAIFGQTEGLLGNELDLRDLQKGARIGRIEVDVETNRGRSTGIILLPSAMDKVESAILAAALETIDRIGPAKATVHVDKIEDTRLAKRDQVVNRAKELLSSINEDPAQDSGRITDEVRNAVQVAEIAKFRNTKIWCGPNVETADSIIIVEGRSDVLNLLKFGIKNTIAVEGTNIPVEVQDLTREKTTTIFVDGDRGGELVARELLETCEVDFVARAPNTREVEELPHKLVMKCLKNKTTAEQFISQHGLNIKKGPATEKGAVTSPAASSERSPERSSERSTERSSDRKTSDRAPAADREPRGDDEKAGRARRGRRGGRGKRDDDTEGEQQKLSTPVEDAEPAEDQEDQPAPRSRTASPARKSEPKGREPVVKAAPKKRADDPRAGLRDALSGLAGTLKATLLDDAGTAIRDGLAVRELADTLKGGKDAVHTVVFDGVITQRLLDIAADKKVQTVVGVKMGNVTKVPDTVEILTKDDLN